MENEMKKKLGWFDRMLIKIAVAKAAARNGFIYYDVVPSLTESLSRAFEAIDADRSCASPLTGGKLTSGSVCELSDTERKSI
jgi:hypothetical protein